MKTLISLLSLILFSCSLYAQTEIQKLRVTQLKQKSIEQYKKDIGVTTFDEEKSEKNRKKLFNNKMMNIYFSEKIATQFGNSSDLTLQKFYASIKSDDKSISIGTNFDFRKKDELKKLTYTLSIGFKIKAKNEFATISKSGDLQEDNITFNAKFTRIGYGSINFKAKKKKDDIIIDREKAIRAYRDKILEKNGKYEKAISKYVSESFSSELNENNLLLESYPNYPNSEEKILNTKAKALYEEIARDEIAYMNKYDLYQFVSNNWLSFEINAPLGEVKYLVADNETSGAKKRYFTPFDMSLKWTYYREYSKGWSIYFNPLFLSLENNNTVLANNLSTKAFQTFTSGANGIQVLSNSDDVYLTEYKNFLTTSAKGELSIFVKVKDVVYIGVSPSVDFNFGTYNETNWKLGVPVSLLDKDGKPKVNFEIQWKEVKSLKDSQHFIGITSSFIFGKLIN